MRNSPYTKTPPSKLAIIPDILNEDILTEDNPISPPHKVTSPEPALGTKHKDGELRFQVRRMVCHKVTTYFQYIVYQYVSVYLSCTTKDMV